MKQIYSTLKTLAFAAMAMVATTATAQETVSFKGTFTELQEMFKFPVSTSGDSVTEKAGNLAGSPIDFGLVTLSATDNNNTPTRMWATMRKKAQEGGDTILVINSVSLRVYSKSSITLKANKEGIKMKRIAFTAGATGFTASVGTMNGSEWTGDASEVTFTNEGSKGIFVTAIDATLEVDETTSIAAATAPAVLAGATPVYNLQGQKVATYATFLTLPKGIYVVNGQKVVR